MDDLLETLTWICIWVACGALVFMLAWMSPSMHGVKKVDCSIAEFSPDISNEIKQLCREARKTK
jgi:hypothetical protein